MTTRKFGTRVEFETAYTSERSGFGHSATLFIDNERMIKQVCHYNNRTWESYPFQTAMKKCFRTLIERTKDATKIADYTQLLSLLGE